LKKCVLLDLGHIIIWGLGYLKLNRETCFSLSSGFEGFFLVLEFFWFDASFSFGQILNVFYFEMALIF